MGRQVFLLVVGYLVVLLLPTALRAQEATFQVYMPVVMRAVEEFSYSAEALAVTELTNQHRQAAGCPPLKLEPRLTQAAQGHSEDMALNDFFSHTGSDGSSPWDRIRAAGYDFVTAGENIAAGYPDPQSVVTAWMNSPGHRANILNCQFEEIGVGYYYLPNDPGQVRYRYYWTQVFAKPR